jgi:hypothetical protein
MFTAGGCTDHNKDCIYNCEDCDQLICKVCANKAHKKHDFVNIKDSNQKVQTEISKHLDYKVCNVRVSEQSIEKKEKAYKREVEATRKAIVEHGNIIKAMVDKKVDALIKTLKKRESIEMQSLSKASAGCKELLGEVTRQQQIYQDMIKQSDEVALFQKMKTIKSDIDNLKSIDITRLPLATYSRKHVNFSEVEKMFGKLTFQ